jgi:chromosome segregation ATPase
VVGATMLILKRLTGVLAILIGIVGAIACALGIYYTGEINREVKQFAEQVFVSVENSVSGIHDQMNRFDLSAKDLRSQLNTLFSELDGLETKPIETESTVRIADLKRNVAFKEKLARARHLVSSVSNAAGALNNLLTFVNASEFLKTQIETEVLLEKIRTSQAALDRLSDMLNKTSEIALQLQNTPDNSHIYATLKEQLGKMQGSLKAITALPPIFIETINKSEERVFYYKTQTATWLRMGFIIIPLVLVWLGAGQVSLIILGTCLCKRKRIA